MLLLKVILYLWVIYIYSSEFVSFKIIPILNLLLWLLYAGFTAEQQLMSVDVIRKAYQATEDGFMSLVTKQWPLKPQIAAVGSCCLVGVICNGTLYIANLGDSRAVLGRVMKATGEVLAIQLSAEHNVCIESVRQELHSLHPEDPQIVVLKHNVWRVKGLIQVSFIQCEKLVTSTSFVSAETRKENLCVPILWGIAPICAFLLIVCQLQFLFYRVLPFCWFSDMLILFFSFIFKSVKVFSKTRGVESLSQWSIPLPLLPLFSFFSGKLLKIEENVSSIYFSGWFHLWCEHRPRMRHPFWCVNS